MFSFRPPQAIIERPLGRAWGAARPRKPNLVRTLPPEAVKAKLFIFFAPPGPVPRCFYMASRGSNLRQSSFGGAHFATRKSRPSGGESDDDESLSDGSSTSQSTMDAGSDCGEDGDFAFDIAYPSTDAPFHLHPNLADTDELVASPPTAAAAAVETEDAPPLRQYRYVHSSWNSGDFVLLQELRDDEAAAVNAIINHFNSAVDDNGDLVFANPFKLYHNIVHLEMQDHVRAHIMSACGFRMNHEPMKE